MAIRWDKLTVKAQEAVQRANDLASEHGNPELQPVHILAALLEDHEGIVAPLLERGGLQVPAVQARARAQIERRPKVSGGGLAPHWPRSWRMTRASSRPCWHGWACRCRRSRPRRWCRWTACARCLAEAPP